MKKCTLIWIFALFTLLTTGCTNSQLPNDNTYHQEWDYPNMFNIQGYGLEMTSAEKGYYFLHENLIYYMDKNSKQTVLLDNRPDNHCKNKPDSTNCNAFVEKTEPNPPNFIQYYNSQLYVLENFWDKESKRSKFDTIWKLSRLDLDGKNRKEIKKFDTAPRSIAIHRGYLYYSVVSAGKDNVLRTQVLREKLEGTKKEEVLFTDKGMLDDITDIVPYGNQLYWIAWTSKGGYLTQRYDLDSGKISSLWDREDGSSNILLNISEDKLYFSYFYGEPGDKRALQIYSSDLNGGQIEEVKIEHPPVLSKFFKDKTYTYIRPIDSYSSDLPQDYPYELAIFKNNKKIHTVNLSSLTKLNETIVGDDKFMFIRYMGQGKKGILYLDKTLIESGKADFQPLLESKTE
ncbi:hypothetical protein [Paenibacillus chitinolyticus]|uniref:hypothetical protein n=1 Tax=Paenibacillus chitinolyticus TaxID=79263 RepID=UPI003D061D89